MNNNGSVVSFCSKFALFQRGKSRITLFLWVKMKVERVMGIEPTRQIIIEEVVFAAGQMTERTGFCTWQASGNTSSL
tara:strand:- start:74 stop:304 length:231 start_codon:yes stop_codon:yes gene_type:complete